MMQILTKIVVGIILSFVILILYGACKAASDTDDQMEEYWRQRKANAEKMEN